GCRLLQHLGERAKQGVKVRLLVDAVGSHRLRHHHLDRLRASGAEVAWFNPVRLRIFRYRRADFRSHRKIVVCDGRVGFTGGMNITDAHTAEVTGDQAWRDTHLRLVGSAVRALQRTFIDHWDLATAQLAADGPEYFPVGEGKPGPRIVHIVASGPGAAILPT